MSCFSPLKAQNRAFFPGPHKETETPKVVLPQVLRLSHATERILRGEQRAVVLRAIIIGIVERF